MLEGFGRRLGAACVLTVTMLVLAACSSSGDDSNDSRDRSTTSAVAGCSPTRAAAPGTTTNTLSSGGVDRKYILTVPATYDGATRTPVIVNLHGFTSTAEEQNAMSRLPELGGDRGYIVVTPQATDADLGTVAGPLWNTADAITGVTLPEEQQDDITLPPNDDVAFVNTLVDTIEKQLCVDDAREYVTGMSNGAGMATWLICQPSNRFAAAAPVAGLTMGKVCPATSLPPFITIHGDQDPAVPYTGGDLAGFPLGIPAVEDRAAEFAAKEGCTAGPTESRVAADVVHIVWECPEGKAAEIYKVLGGGHAWPGAPVSTPGWTQSIDASEVILDFFDTYAQAGK